MKINISPARTAAYKILYDVFENKAFSNISVNKHIDLSLKNESDRKLAVHIVYGTIKKKNRLEKILSEFSNIPVGQIHPSVRVILFFSLYQIIYMDKIPEYALVNDAANMCKFYRQQAAVGFANAVLRNAIRQKTSLLKKESDPQQLLHAEYGFPIWLTEMLKNQYSMEKIISFAQASEDIPEIYIKVNTYKTNESSLMDAFAEKGIVTEKTYVPDTLKVIGTNNIFMSEEYKKGLFFAQDISGTLSGFALNPNHGDKIIDLCSAPGGKSFHAAILSDNTDILSCDIIPNKLELVKRSARQLGLSGIKVVKRDASVLWTDEQEQYDKVICDVPCSGIGVIRRKPDILSRITKEYITELIALQKSILENGIHYLKPGGILIYSTCTINRDENTGVVESMMRERNDLELVPITMPFQLKTVHPEMQNGMLQLFPGDDECDGFFMAKIMRKKR